MHKIPKIDNISFSKRATKGAQVPSKGVSSLAIVVGQKEMFYSLRLHLHWFIYRVVKSGPQNTGQASIKLRRLHAKGFPFKMICEEMSCGTNKHCICKNTIWSCRLNMSEVTPPFSLTFKNREWVSLIEKRIFFN